MSAFVEGVLLLLQQGLFCFLFKTTGFFINTGEIESEIDEKQKARNDRFNEQVRGGGGVEGLDGGSLPLRCLSTVVSTALC